MQNDHEVKIRQEFRESFMKVDIVFNIEDWILLKIHQAQAERTREILEMIPEKCFCKYCDDDHNGGTYLNRIKSSIEQKYENP